MIRFLVRLLGYVEDNGTDVTDRCIKSVAATSYNDLEHLLGKLRLTGIVRSIDIHDYDVTRSQLAPLLPSFPPDLLNRDTALTWIDEVAAALRQQTSGAVTTSVSPEADKLLDDLLAACDRYAVTVYQDGEGPCNLDESRNQCYALKAKLLAYIEDLEAIVINNGYDFPEMRDVQVL